MKNRKRLYLLIGPFLFLLALFLIPEHLFPFSSRVVIGTILWMAAWWIGLPVESSVTTLLPIAVNAVFNVMDMSAVISNYMSETTLLVFTSGIVSLSWKETKLDKRIALKALSLVGTSMAQQTVVWFLLSTVLSAVLPNIVVCAMLLSIACAMLKYSGEITDDLSSVAKSKPASLILAVIAWGAFVGGMGTPLGGAMNLVAVDYFQQLTGHEFAYVDWVIHVFPLFVPVTAVSAVILALLCPKGKTLNGTREYFIQSYKELPSMSRDEAISGALFLLPSLLSFLRPLYSGPLPGLKNAYVFLLFALLSFLVRKKDGTPMLTWKGVEKGAPWGLLFLVSSGLALGGMLSATGTTQIIADHVSTLGLTGGFVTILVFNLFSMLIAEISTNTTAASLSIPVIISVMQGLGQDPIPYLYINIAAFNCSFIMPTSVRSMPIGYGVEPRFFFRNGLLLSAGAVVVITVLGYALLIAFPTFMGAA